MIQVPYSCRYARLLPQSFDVLLHAAQNYLEVWYHVSAVPVLDVVHIPTSMENFDIQVLGRELELQPSLDLLVL